MRDIYWRSDTEEMIAQRAPAIDNLLAVIRQLNTGVKILTFIIS